MIDWRMKIEKNLILKAFNTVFVKDMQCAGFYFALLAERSDNFSYEKIMLSSYIYYLWKQLSFEHFGCKWLSDKMEFSFVITQLGISHYGACI